MGAKIGRRGDRKMAHASLPKPTEYQKNSNPRTKSEASTLRKTKCVRKFQNRKKIKRSCLEKLLLEVP